MRSLRGGDLGVSEFSRSAWSPTFRRRLVASKITIKVRDIATPRAGCAGPSLMRISQAILLVIAVWLLGKPPYPIWLIAIDRDLAELTKNLVEPAISQARKGVSMYE